MLYLLIAFIAIELVILGVSFLFYTVQQLYTPDTAYNKSNREMGRRMFVACSCVVVFIGVLYFYDSVHHPVTEEPDHSQSQLNQGALKL